MLPCEDKYFRIH